MTSAGVMSTSTTSVATHVTGATTGASMTSTGSTATGDIGSMTDMTLGSDATSTSAATTSATLNTSGTSGGASDACPEDMAQVGESCVDRYEAPNLEGAPPLVMYTFDEAESWCQSRGKRLCLDSEWTAACEGPEAWPFPYGRHVPGVCNDDKPWLPYNQQLLNGWPWDLETDAIESLAQLFAVASARSPAAAQAAEHVASLYQGEAAGAREECVGPAGVYDLTGNVEEWPRRADGGTEGFHGNLKGRYWADLRTCQDNITVHGDGFRFYEIGFRCCAALR